MESQFPDRELEWGPTPVTPKPSPPNCMYSIQHYCTYMYVKIQDALCVWKLERIDSVCVWRRPNCLNAWWNGGLPQASACSCLIKSQTVNQRVSGTARACGGSTVPTAVLLTHFQLPQKLTATMHTHSIWNSHSLHTNRFQGFRAFVAHVLWELMSRSCFGTAHLSIN